VSVAYVSLNGTNHLLVLSLAPREESTAGAKGCVVTVQNTKTGATWNAAYKCVKKGRRPFYPINGTLIRCLAQDKHKICKNLVLERVARKENNVVPERKKKRKLSIKRRQYKNRLRNRRRRYR